MAPWCNHVAELMGIFENHRNYTPEINYPLIHPVRSTASSMSDSKSNIFITPCDTGTLNMIKASATTAMINMMMAMIIILQGLEAQEQQQRYHEYAGQQQAGY